MCGKTESQIRKISSKLYVLTKDVASRVNSLDDCAGNLTWTDHEVKIGRLIVTAVTEEIEIMSREGKKLVKKLEEAINQAEGK